ncbi:MAG: Uma2 family endonuclease [Bryobacteraceae bacterium]|nr:Uma2 family endonuclease [Bryobacteraceae bacterium]
MAAATPILQLFPPIGEWTEADYFPLSDQGRLVELSNGEIEILPMPTDFHQLLLLRLTASLYPFVAQHKLGQIRFAPLPVRLWEGKIREPDFLFMSAAHADRIGTYWGIPDLAGEILSEGTVQKDRETKRIEYARAGIPEYWIIDPWLRSVERLELAGSVYVAAAASEVLSSPQFPGWSLPLTELFAE